MILDATSRGIGFIHLINDLRSMMIMVLVQADKSDLERFADKHDAASFPPTSLTDLQPINPFLKQSSKFTAEFYSFEICMFYPCLKSMVGDDEDLDSEQERA